MNCHSLHFAAERQRCIAKLNDHVGEANGGLFSNHCALLPPGKFVSTEERNVEKGVRLLNEVKKRAAFSTEENSSWGRRVVGFE